MEEVGGGGEVGERFGMEICGLLRGEDEAFFGEADGWGHVLCEGQAAKVGLREGEAGDGAGNAGGLVALDGEVWDHVAGGVQVHVAGGGGGSFFAGSR